MSIALFFASLGLYAMLLEDDIRSVRPPERIVSTALPDGAVPCVPMSLHANPVTGMVYICTSPVLWYGPRMVPAVPRRAER